MFKKLLIASAVLVATTTVAYANHDNGDSYKNEKDEACPTCWTYTPPNGAYVGLNLGVRNNYTGAPAVFKGIEASLALGYGMLLYPSIYGAAELWGGDSFVVKNFHNCDGGSVRTTWNYGIDVIPGLLLTDYVMAFLRFGVIRSHFNQPDVNRTGWRAGIGGQSALAQNWDIRAEYVYSLGFDRISGVGRPREDLFNIGVLYRFM